MRPTRSLCLVFILALAVAASPAARASCGSASCPIDSNALNLPDPGGWSVDLSFQYIDQDQPRIGTDSAEVGEIPSEHDEVRTLNRATALALHRAFGPGLLLGVVVPYQNRFHQHIAHEEEPAEKHGGEDGEVEQWDLDGIGDVLLDGQWRAWSAGRTSLWLTGAVKLPTGKDDATNGEEIAEVPIQTGSGSTDVVVGGIVRGSVVRKTAQEGPMGGFAAVPWFVSTTFRRNGSGRDDYRIGSEWQLNGGGAYPLGSRADLMLQLNWRYRQKDDVGTSGEDPELTGGKYLFLSPGVRFVVHWPWALYAYVQQPLYQDVNGLQLTARRNWLFGAQGRW